MAQWLETGIALAKVPSSVPSTYIRQQEITCNTRPIATCWPAQALHSYTQPVLHMRNLTKINLKKKSPNLKTSNKHMYLFIKHVCHLTNLQSNLTNFSIKRLAL